MSVSLQKGQKVSLSKENPGLSRIVVGLGWDEAQPSKSGGFFGALFSAPTQPIDCDASAFLLKNGRLTESKDIVYFGNLTHYTRAVQHMGDNLTGAGEGDDEQIVIVVNIYSAYKRNQHFGMIRNAFIRIVNAGNGQEMLKYNLTENYSGMTAMIFGEIYRYNGEWKFAAVGSGTNDGSISALAKRYQ